MKSQPTNHNTASADLKKEWLLYSGIKSLLRCDESETVRGIARYVIAQHDSLRIGEKFVERNRHNFIPQIAAFLGAATRFLEIRRINKKDGVIWIARLDNECRAIEKFTPLFPELNFTELKLERPPDCRALFALPRQIFPLRSRIFKLTRLLLRRNYDFFKILRVVEMLGYYAHFLEVFRKAKFSLAVMSSHSNPHGIAFNLAARKHNVPTILVSHGMPVPPVAKLYYDLAIVHCEAARQTYLAEDFRAKEYIVHGRAQDFAPMPEILPVKSLTVGIFLCKDVNEHTLRRFVAQLLENPRVGRILIRPHPKNLFVKFDSWFAALPSNRVQKSSGNSISDDLGACDVVFGGNSSVLIEAVTAGKPTGYVGNLDYGSPDLHRLVAAKLVYPIDPEIDFDKMFDFYRRPDWLDILRKFADIDTDESTFSQRITEAIRFLIKQR